MDDRRRFPRKIATQVMDVSDTITGRHLGRVVNFSQGGFLLMGTNPIQSETVLQLEMVLNIPGAEEKRVSFGAECLWHSEASQPGHYWSGFQFIDISLEVMELFDRLLKQD